MDGTVLKQPWKGEKDLAKYPTLRIESNQVSMMKPIARQRDRLTLNRDSAGIYTSVGKLYTSVHEYMKWQEWTSPYVPIKFRHLLTHSHSLTYLPTPLFLSDSANLIFVQVAELAVATEPVNQWYRGQYTYGQTYILTVKAS